jgi:hypothetical protein
VLVKSECSITISIRTKKIKVVQVVVILFFFEEIHANK